MQKRRGATCSQKKGEGRKSSSAVASYSGTSDLRPCLDAFRPTSGYDRLCSIKLRMYRLCASQTAGEGIRRASEGARRARC